MQARTVVRIADIHARALADGVESLQDPDRFRTVFDGNGMLSVGDGLPGWFSHVGAFEGVPNQRGKRRSESLYLCHERRIAPSAK
jgi:hypothetical protein